MFVALASVEFFLRAACTWGAFAPLTSPLKERPLRAGPSYRPSLLFFIFVTSVSDASRIDSCHYHSGLLCFIDRQNLSDSRSFRLIFCLTFVIGLPTGPGATCPLVKLILSHICNWSSPDENLSIPSRRAVYISEAEICQYWPILGQSWGRSPCGRVETILYL